MVNLHANGKERHKHAIMTKIRIEISFSMDFEKILLLFKKFTLTLHDISTKSF